MNMLQTFQSQWQSLPHHLNPVFVQIGGFQIRYYGLMFVGAVLAAVWLMHRRIKKQETLYSSELIENYLMWAILGVVLGGRLGYVFFYQWGYYSRHALEIFLPFDFSDGARFTGLSGMSYHGGLLGGILASYLFCRRHRIHFWKFADFVIPCVPAGYLFGRIGNFLNGELYGRPTQVPWGMYFPDDPEGLLRHPSQLYEAFGEGALLFLLLWSIRNKKFPSGGLLAIYLIGYGAVRFVIEYYREPDYFLGFVFLHFSMGQVLCFGMILAGVLLYAIRARAGRRKKDESE